MASADPDEPVVMLNLLRFRGQAQPGCGVDGLSGREAYRIYGQRFAELHPKYGGEPIWMGRAHNSIIGSEEWDIVILVRYRTVDSSWPCSMTLIIGRSLPSGPQRWLIAA